MADESLKEQLSVADVEFRRDVTTGITDIKTTVTALSISFAEFKASVMSRADIEAAVATRVSTELFEATNKATNERITRLEGTWNRIVPWAALVVSICMLILYLVKL